jgi:hypothetical protein
MGTTLNLLIRIGFTLDHVEEWAPTESQITAQPELAEELERPIFCWLRPGAGEVSNWRCAWCFGWIVLSWSLCRGSGRLNLHT